MPSPNSDLREIILATADAAIKDASGDDDQTIETLLKRWPRYAHSKTHRKFVLRLYRLVKSTAMTQLD